MSAPGENRGTQDDGSPVSAAPDTRAPGDTLAGRLTRTLIVWVGGVWLLCVLGVVWYVDREINHNFDNELVEVSHRMFGLALREFENPSRNGATTLPLIAPQQLFPDDRAALPAGRRRPSGVCCCAPPRRRPTPSTCRWPPASPMPAPGASTRCIIRRANCSCRWPTRWTNGATRSTAR